MSSSHLKLCVTTTKRKVAILLTQQFWQLSYIKMCSLLQCVCSPRTHERMLFRNFFKTLIKHLTTFTKYLFQNIFSIISTLLKKKYQHICMVVLLIPALQPKIPNEINPTISRRFNDLDCWDVIKVLKDFKEELIVREKLF